MIIRQQAVVFIILKPLIHRFRLNSKDESKTKKKKERNIKKVVWSLHWKINCLVERKIQISEGVFTQQKDYPTFWFHKFHLHLFYEEQLVLDLLR